MIDVLNPLSYHKISMTPLTIPRELTKNGELVVISRKEYEQFLDFQRKKIKEVVMTPSQKKALARSRTNFLAGKSLTFHELTRKLGVER